MSSAPFPRGSGGDAAVDATKRPRDEAQEDSIFGLKRTRRIEVVKANGGANKKSGSVSAAALLKSPLAGAVGLGMTRSSGNSKALKIDNVSFTKYVQGTLALGYILQIMDNFLVISLPGGVTGTVSISEISDSLHRLSNESFGTKGSKSSSKLADIRTLVTAMQPVRCYVLNVIEKGDKQKKSLVLSMRSSLVNRGQALKHMVPGYPISGCISSKEDHGYIVSCGVSAVNFFLPFKAVPLALLIGVDTTAAADSTVAAPTSADLPVGQPIECVVEAVNEAARSVTLRAQRKATMETLTKGLLLPFNALCPGMKFQVSVEKIAQNGLLVKFLNDFHGVIDTFSLPRPMSAQEWKAQLGEGEDKEKKLVEARIVFVDHGSRSVRLSMRPHVLELRGPVGMPVLGSTLDNLTVKSASKKQGVLLAIGDVEAQDATLAMSIISRAGDKAEAEEGGAKVKGAARLDKKMMAADAKRKREINESVQGVFVHKSALADLNASDDAEEKKGKKNGKSPAVSEDSLEKQYKVGEKVETVRVVGYHLVEGFAVATNMGAIISSGVLHWSEVSVGQTLPASVVAVRDFGLVMKISANVQAVCPLLHLSDTGLTLSTVQIGKKFKVGQTLNVRVWEATGSALIVTLKKSIVEDKETSLLSYDDAVEGKISLGVVSRAGEKGLKVTFFNSIKGSIPMSVLARQGVADAADSYRVGQVVRCVVLKKTVPKDGKGSKGKPKVLLGLAVGSCDAAEIKSLLAAMLPEGEEPAVTTAVVSKPSSASTEEEEDMDVVTDSASTAIVSTLKKAGEFVSGVVYKIEGDNLSVRLSDGRLGQLHKEQCTDFAAHSEAYFTAGKNAPYYTIGTKITGALVLSTTKKVLVLSLKPLLLSATQDSEEEEAISVPDNVADLHPGQVVAGYVFKVESYGVMVRFREGLTALVPRPNVADRFVSTPVGLFNVGDSVRCVIQRVDLARERVIATFKSAVVGPSSGSSCFLRAMLKEGSSAAQITAASEGKGLPDWKKFPLGSVVTGTVSSVESYGVVLTAADMTTMMLARGIHSKKGVTVGQAAKVLILDMDYKNRVLDVTMDEELITKMTTPAVPEKKGKKTASSSSAVLASLSVKGSVVKGRVELLQSEGKYLVVSLSKSAIAYVMLTDYHCPSLNEPAEYAEHQEISLLVESPSGGEGPYGPSAILSVQKGAQRDQTARIQQDAETSDASVREKKDGKGKDPAAIKQAFLDSVRVGAVLTWRVVSVTPLEVLVKPDYFESMGLDLKAAVHLTGTVDQTIGKDDLKKTLSKAPERSKSSSTEILAGHPFFGIAIGGKLLARIVQLRRSGSAKEGSKKSEDSDKLILYLSVDGLAAEDDSCSGKRKREDAAKETRGASMLQLWGKNSLVTNGAYAGCITKMEETCCVVSLSPYISSRLHFMDVSKDETVVKLFMQRACVGQRVVVQVTSFTFDAKDKSKPKGIIIGRARIEEAMGGSLKELCGKVVMEADSSSSSADVKLGSLVYGLLDLKSQHQHHRVSRLPALSVSLGNGQTGRICLTELSDPSDWKDCSHLMAAPSSSSKAVEQLPNGRRHGEMVQCRVISVPSSGGEGDVIELSLRPSRLACKSKKNSFLPDPIPLDGSVIQAYVVNCSSKGKGCFLRLTHSITGQVLMKDLSDEFVTDPHLSLPMGKLVTARVLSASQTDNTAKLSLKGSVVLGDKKADEDIQGIKVRSTIEGTVQRVTPIGVFIAIKGTSLVGLSRRQAACEDSEELSEMYEVGSFVRAKVLSVAKTSKKVALGLKPSFFVKEDIHGKDNSDDESEGEEEESEGDDDEEEEEDDEDEVEGDDDEEDEDDDNVAMLDEEDDGSDAEMDAMIRAASVQPMDSDDEEEEEQPKKKSQKNEKKAKDVVVEEDENSDDEEDSGPSIFAAPKKGKGAGMLWSDFKPKETAATLAVKAQEESEGEESEEEEKSGKGRTRQKEALKRKEEQAIRAREASLQEGTLVPERPEDFERLLLAEPSSSLLWVKYMSHYLLQADLDATRQIAERALRTIGFKEEEEKLNVWLAFINMEYKYGDMASLEKVFKRAVAESNGKLIHLNLAEAYETAKDGKGAAAVFDKALKKYKTSKKVWMAYQHFMLRAGDSEGAKALLSRSMQSLSRHKHVEVIIKYAVCEFDEGSEDRGRSVFEELVGSYPKRTDLWHVYVDKEVKSGNYPQARQLFERMVASKGNAKAMKAVFKKFLTFEQLNGSMEQQEAVKVKAREYVKSII